MFYRVFKHSKHCQYIFDCYRVEADSEDQAIEKVKAKTGIIGDYVNKGSGSWDHPHIIDID
tara:strand:+ start:61 stop:243 length:183 start_codon:yes stop_codon:yes gene_type:complete